MGTLTLGQGQCSSDSATVEGKPTDVYDHVYVNVSKEHRALVRHRQQCNNGESVGGTVASQASSAARASFVAVGLLAAMLSPWGSRADETGAPQPFASVPATDAEAPRWQRWQNLASRSHKSVPDLAGLPSLSFREELHAIEAAIAGQGVAICSNVLVGPELASGALVPVSRIRLPGYGFYIVHRAGHPKLGSIKAFANWARTVR